MAAAKQWKALTGDAGGEVVLCVDFEATGRPEASFTDLAPLLAPHHEVWTTMVPQASPGAALTAADYMAHWTDGLTTAGRRIRSVVGFCAGAVFGAQLAEEIGERMGDRPVVVLLDPEIPTVSTLIAQFAGAMKGVAKLLTPDESSRAAQVQEDARGVADLASAAVALAAAYEGIAGPVFSRLGLKADYRDDLIASFAALMAYLVAAGGIRPSPAWGSATVILSSDAPDPVWSWNDLIRLGVGHVDLLRSPETAKAVAASSANRAHPIKELMTDA